MVWCGGKHLCQASQQAGEGGQANGKASADCPLNAMERIMSISPACFNGREPDTLTGCPSWRCGRCNTFGLISGRRPKRLRDDGNRKGSERAGGSGCRFGRMIDWMKEGGTWPRVKQRHAQLLHGEIWLRSWWCSVGTLAGEGVGLQPCQQQAWVWVRVWVWVRARGNLRM